MADNSQTVGVYFNEDETEELLEEFDDFFEQWYAKRNENYSRSREIKAAMWTHLGMLEACRQLGQTPPERPMQVRHWISSALHDWEAKHLANRTESDA